MTFVYAVALTKAKEYQKVLIKLKTIVKYYVFGGVTDLTHLCLSARGIVPSFEDLVDLLKKLIILVIKKILVSLSIRFTIKLIKTANSI